MKPLRHFHQAGLFAVLVGWLWLPGLADAQSIPSIVDPPWLIKNLEAPNLVLLDLRRRNEYRAGHVAASVSIDPVVSTFRRADTAGVGRLPGPELFAQQMGELGISHDDRLVLISRGESWLDMATATDLFWLLKRFGHQHVAILNGGYRRLAQLGGFPVSKDTPSRPAVDYRVGESLVRPASLAVLARSDVTLVDARLRGQYLGINKTAAVNRRGTVPGALSLPGNWVTNDAGGRIRRGEELLPILAMAGVPTEGAVVVFGNTSLAGSLVWFALRVVLGNTEVRLLEGGIAEWLNNPANELSVPFRSGARQQP